MGEQLNSEREGNTMVKQIDYSSQLGPALKEAAAAGATVLCLLEIFLKILYHYNMTKKLNQIIFPNKMKIISAIY